MRLRHGRMEKQRSEWLYYPRFKAQSQSGCSRRRCFFAIVPATSAETRSLFREILWTEAAFTKLKLRWIIDDDDDDDVNEGSSSSPFSLSRRGFTTLRRHTRENAYAPSFRAVGIPFQPFFLADDSSRGKPTETFLECYPVPTMRRKSATENRLRCFSCDYVVHLSERFDWCLANTSIVRNASKNPFAPTYVDSIEIDPLFFFFFFASRST